METGRNTSAKQAKKRVKPGLLVSFPHMEPRAGAETMALGLPAGPDAWRYKFRSGGARDGKRSALPLARQVLSDLALDTHGDGRRQPLSSAGEH